MAPPRARRSQGRRKIEMKLIPDENARMVTFSKRRAGVFKKATELSILCGAQIAIVVFSPGGRAYSFGHPDVASVLDHFSDQDPMPNPQDFVQATIDPLMLQQLKEQSENLNQELKMEKKRGKELEAALESSPYHIRDERVNLLDLDQLHELKLKMENLGENVRQMVNSILFGSPVPQSATDGAGPSDPKKSAGFTSEMDGPDEFPTPPVGLESEAVNLASAEKEGRHASPTVPVDRCASPIPHDWLSL